MGLTFGIVFFLTFVLMIFTAGQIAGILEGVLEGDPEIAVHKLAKIEEGEKGALTFLANPKYTSYIYSTKASITIVNKDFVPEQKLETTLIKVDDAYESFSRILEYYNRVKKDKNRYRATGISFKEHIIRFGRILGRIYVRGYQCDYR